MKKIIAIAAASILLTGANLAYSMDTKGGHDDHSGMNHQAEASHDSMDHSNMNHGSMDHGGMDGTHKYGAMADGIHGEFQIMELASMNMKDPEGRTHHIMVSFMQDGKKLENLAGKVKVIAPSGKEQVADLKDFGSGVFAANFSFDEPGKWGVICLFKDTAGKHTMKFWYPHGAM